MSEAGEESSASLFGGFTNECQVDVWYWNRYRYHRLFLLCCSAQYEHGGSFDGRFVCINERVEVKNIS